MKCPCCKSDDLKELTLITEWGLEYFSECLACGVIFRER